jgi:protocatechuate 3,4-dioxygenase beta subunit
MKTCGKEALLVGLFLVCWAECAGAGAATGREYTGDFVLNRETPVNLAAGTPAHPRLVEISWLRIEPVYGNAWALTARVGWSPVAEATWSIRIELLDDKGNILTHSRDRATTFTGKADGSKPGALHYAELGLDPMHWEMRRHAARVRVILEPAVTPPANPSGNHSVVVSIIDAGSRKPIPGVVVVARASHRGRQDRAHVYLHRTDAQGECRVAFDRTDLRVASVSAQKPGYAAFSKSWSGRYSSLLVTPPLTELPERHVLAMPPAQTIGGTVQDPSGRPIAGAEVRVNVDLEEAYGGVSVSRCLDTDREGHWRVDGIPVAADPIRLGFSHPDYLGDEWANTRVTGGDVPALRDLKYVTTMTRGLTVSGRVLDDEGRPVPRAAVVLARAYSGGFQYGRTDTLTDASGQFRFGCARNDLTDSTPDGGSTGVLVEVPGYLPALQRAVVEPNLAPLEFRLRRGRALTVRVVDANDRPLAGAWTVVHVLREDPRYGLWREDTDEQGRFVIPNVPDHEICLTVGKSGYRTIRDHVLAASEGRPVVTMKTSPCLRGSVLDAGTGKPIPAFEIVAVPPDPERMEAGGPYPFKDGRFELVFDEPRTGMDSLELKVLAVGYKPATSGSVRLEGTRSVEFKLTADPSFDAQALRRERGGLRSSEPTVVTGAVVDPNGRPVPQAEVILVGPFHSQVASDAEGRFKLRLPMMGRMPEEMVPHIIARDRERNLAVASEFDATAAEDLVVKLAPGTILSGRITDAQGQGLPAARISLIFRAGRTGFSLPETAQSDADGRYEIRGMPGGQSLFVIATVEGYGQASVSVQTVEAVSDRIELETMVLQVANLDISGTVVDSNDKPVPGARLFSYGSGQPQRQVQSDGQGRFVIRGVCAGAVQIQANTSGRDRTNLFGLVRTEGGAADVKIVIGSRGSAGSYVPARPPSLVGKLLPALADVGIESPADAYKDRKLLLCFFDVDQRPSRNCLATLAGRAEELRQKDVILLGVQAGDADRSALEQWLKGRSIDVPVGRIEADVKKTTFAWGVRSLPWLILTDTQHKVVAEGFAVGELDAKVEPAGP